MATVLTLRNTTTSGITDTGDGVLYDLLVNSFGASEDLYVTDTAAGGTNIQWTQSAGGPTIAWISGRVPAGGFTLTSTTLSVWWAESHMNANAGGRFRVYRYQPGTPTITEIGSFDSATELAVFVTTLTEESIVGNVTDTAFAENDRILLRMFVRNAGTMASGHTCTVGFNGASGSQSDSTLTIAETVAFKANDLRVTPAAEGVSVSEVVAAILPERRAQISWIEFEVPEFEVPLEPTISVTDALTVAEVVSVSNPVLPTSATDAVSVSELLAVQVLLLPQIVDALSVADVPTVNLLVQPQLTDAVSLAEVSALNMLLLPTAVDTLSVGEVAPVNVVLQPQALDAVSLAEIPTIEVLLQPQALDALSVSETPTVQIPVLPAAALETVTVAEVVAASLGAVPPLTVGVTEEVNLAEVQTVDVLLQPQTTEAVSVTELPTLDVVLRPQITEAISLADVPTADLVVMPQALDALSLTELPPVDLLVMPQALDAVSVAEVPVIDVVLKPAVTEPISLSETAPVDVVLKPVVLDALSVSETPAAALPILPVVALEGITVSETALVSTGGIVPVSITATETVSLAEVTIVLNAILPALAMEVIRVQAPALWLEQHAIIPLLTSTTRQVSNLIPANSLVIGVPVHVLQTITGPTSIDVGDGTDVNHWATTLSLTAGTHTTLADQAMTTPAYYPTAADLVVTPTGGVLTGGALAATVAYASLTTGFRQQPWLTTTTTLSSLSGASVTATDLIPANSWVIGVRLEVLSAVTGATGMDIGNGTDPDAWGDNVSVDLGTTTDIDDFTITSPAYYGAATDVVVTAVGSNFTAGQIRLTVYYSTLASPWVRTSTTLSGLSGASVTATGLIPTNSYVIGVQVSILSDITGATGINVGNGTDPDAWGANLTVSQGTLSDIDDFTVVQPSVYGTGGDVVLTAVGSNFSGGTVEIIVWSAPLTLETEPNVDVVLQPVRSDALSLAEVIAAALPILPTSALDTLTLTEVSTINVLLMPIALDALTINDLPVVEVLLRPSVLDALNVSETVTPRVLLQPSVMDAISVTEVALVSTGGVAPLLVSATDALTVVEVVTVANPLLPVGALESLTVAEVMARELLLLPQLTDQVSLAELPKLSIPLSPLLIDALILVETSTTDIILQPHLADDISLADVVQPYLLVELTVTEAISLSENLIISMEAVVPLGVIIAETITVSEQTALTLVLPVMALEAMGLDELSTVELLLMPQMLDAVTLTETSGADVILQPRMIESLTLAETLAVLFPILAIDRTDALNIAEVPRVDLLVMPQVVDAMSLADVTEIMVLIQPKLTESVTLVEVVNVSNPLLFLTALDAVSVAEAVTIDYVLHPKATDALSLVEVRNVIVITPLAVPPLEPPRLITLVPEPLHALTLATSPTHLLTLGETTIAMTLAVEALHSTSIAVTPVHASTVATTPMHAVTVVEEAMHDMTIQMGEPED